MAGQAALYADGSLLLIVDSAGWVEVDVYAKVITSKAEKDRALLAMRLDGKSAGAVALMADGDGIEPAACRAAHADNPARRRYESIKAEADRRESVYQIACAGGDREAELAAKDAAHKAWWEAEKAYLALPPDERQP